MTRKKILLIEDNPANRMVFQDLLQVEGYEVICVGNAEDGITRAREIVPDLVLMDIQLPGMDGLTATRVLRSDKLTREILIVALTSHAMTDDREKCISAGCNGYITKPVRVASFRQEIRELLTQSDSDEDRTFEDENNNQILETKL
jgi:CheY-like chemotaxis protein